MAKIIALRDTQKVSSNQKSVFHILIMPVILFAVLVIIQKGWSVVSALIYIPVIVSYFNIKAYRVRNNVTRMDAESINEHAKNLALVFLMIVVVITALVVG